MFDLESLIRENIKRMKPYSTARHEFFVEGPERSFTRDRSTFLDANENPFGSPLPLKGEKLYVMYNRYPDPLQMMLKEKLATIKNIPAKNIFIGI